MTWSEDIGHRETVTNLPTPTSPPNLVSAASLGLPSEVLTLASLGATVVVFSLVWGPNLLRSFFRLPWPASVSAFVATLLGALVMWGCRRRPGRRRPRYWALGLTAATGLLGLYCLVDPAADGAPWCHAATLAGLTGSLVLLPRLIRVGPERGWVEAVAPVSFASAVLFLAPAIGFVGWSYFHEVERFDQAIARTTTWGAELETDADQARNASGVDLADLDRRLSRMDDLSFEGRSSIQSLWRAATILGREEELGNALTSLIDGVVEGLAPDVAPRVSSLDESAARWDPEAGKWVTSAEFDRMSDLVGLYYQRLGGLFAELDPQRIETESVALADYRERYRKERETLRSHLQTTQGEWTDHWAVARIPGAIDLVGPVEPTLAHLLQTPLLSGEYEALSPADLPDLLNVDVERARSLMSGVPGCHLRRYREDGAAYERVDCAAYSPADGETLGADLRVQVRLVYMAENGANARPGRLPHEVFFLFPVPTARSETDYLEEVARAVADAAEARWAGDLRPLDRSGSMLNGFTLEGAPHPAVVYRPRLVRFLEGRKAVVVRAQRRAG